MHYIISGKESMERAVKMVTACVCLHNYLINHRIANNWLTEEAPNMDDSKVDNEGGGYNFILSSTNSRDERQEQACINMLERTGHALCRM